MTTKKHIYNEDLFTFDYDHDELKDELQIEVNARQQGSMNRPSSDSIGQLNTGDKPRKLSKIIGTANRNESTEFCN